MNNSSDAELLLGLEARDRSAAEALYDRHAARLYAVALRITGGPELAAEVLEQLFLALFDGRARLDGSSVAAGLLRLTRDTALAVQRLRNPAEAQIPISAVDETSPAGLTARQLVERAFYDGETVPALAKAYQLPEETIRLLLREGMAELKAEFASGERNERRLHTR